MSTNKRSLNVTYPARTGSTRAKVQRRHRAATKRKSTVKQSAHSSAFGLALSVGIVGSLGVVAILTFVLLGG